MYILVCTDNSFIPESFVSCFNCWSFFEKSTLTSSLLSNSAAKLPLTIFGEIWLLGPMFASRRLDPKCGFFSLISAQKNCYNFAHGIQQPIQKLRLLYKGVFSTKSRRTSRTIGKTFGSKLEVATQCYDKKYSYLQNWIFIIYMKTLNFDLSKIPIQFLNGIINDCYLK